MQRHLLTIAALALVALGTVPAAAQETGWIVRIHGASVTPLFGVSDFESEVPVGIGTGTAVGAGATLEYRAGSRIGLSLDALHARPPIELMAELPDGARRSSDTLGFTPFTIGPVFHVTPGRPVDLTLTAMLGLAAYSDLRFADSAQTLRLQGSRGFGWGLGAAIDIAPGATPWAIHVCLRRYQATVAFTNRDNGAAEEVAISPVVVVFGVGYRF